MEPHSQVVCLWVCLIDVIHAAWMTGEVVAEIVFDTLVTASIRLRALSHKMLSTKFFLETRHTPAPWFWRQRKLEPVKIQINHGRRVQS